MHAAVRNFMQSRQVDCGGPKMKIFLQKLSPRTASSVTTFDLDIIKEHMALADGALTIAAAMLVMRRDATEIRDLPEENGIWTLDWPPYSSDLISSE